MKIQSNWFFFAPEQRANPSDAVEQRSRSCSVINCTSIWARVRGYQDFHFEASVVNSDSMERVSTQAILRHTAPCWLAFPRKTTFAE
jgi:hypothetical protein